MAGRNPKTGRFAKPTHTQCVIVASVSPEALSNIEHATQVKEGLREAKKRRTLEKLKKKFNK